MFFFPSSFNTAIIDMDGTILDSMGMWQEIDREFLRKRGIPFSDDYGTAMKSRNYRDGAEYTIHRYGLAESPEDLMKEWDQMAREQYESVLQLKPGVREYLMHLKKQGIRLALATVSSEEFIQLALSHNQIGDLFDYTAGSSKVKRGKGYPDIFLHCAEMLSADISECLVFEDSLYSLLGAKSGGFSVCAVSDPSSADDWEKMKASADYILTDFYEGIIL